MCERKKIRIQRIFERLKADHPNPRTELVYHTSFELLISVVLSARATDASVNRATHALYQVANTPIGFLELGQERLCAYIQKIGLYRIKSQRILETCRILIDHHHGEIPKTRVDLEALPGVGRKTANVLLNILYGEPTIAVDTHVLRLAQRLGISTHKTPLKVEQDAVRLIPSAYLKNAHHWLVLHGRRVCTARKPACTSCSLSALCPSACNRVSKMDSDGAKH